MADLLVLCYHALSPTWDTGLSVTPEAFGAQLRHLADHGFEGTTFTRALSEPVRGRRVVVTFDDGYRSVLELAKPALDAVGWPGTLFVPTTFVGSDRPMAWPGIDEWLGTPHEAELLPLGWPELIGLADDGWEIGAHTCRHPHLTEIDDDALGAELAGSREACERELGRPCPSIAYPYGDVDGRVIAAARQAGFTAGAGLPPARHVVDRMQWPRVGVYHDDDLDRFTKKISRVTRAVQRSPVWDLVAALRGARRPAGT